jgi:hypothetical protein
MNAMSSQSSTRCSSSASASSPSLSLDEVIDRLVVMRRQEDSCYAYRHYLPQQLPSSSSNNHGSKRINVTWREKIVTWSYNVVDQ